MAKTINNDEDDYKISWKYYMLQCMGCESISFRIETHDYEVSYPDEYENWIHEITVEVYPKPLKNHSPISEQYNLPSTIRTVYKETLDALKNECNLLAGVGFRAVIEAVCNDKKITGKNLATQIDNLSKNRLITESEAKRLHAVRFLGNDSIHEIAVPKKEALIVVLEIIEHLLRNIYLIDLHAKSVLDTFITEFEDFEDLLLRKLKQFNAGDDYPLAKYLDKDIRRLNNQLTKFEQELINAINNGDFPKLSVGAVKRFGNNPDQLQHFIKQ